MLGRVKVWLLISLSAFGTFAIAECPKGDLTGDCEIDFRDVEAFAAQWLFPSSSPADLDGLNGVEARDLAVLADGWLQAGIPLVINEVMASNSNTNTDPQGQYDDWIEIYNAGHYAIDTGGMHLTDELGNPTKWQIPATSPSATTIQPGDKDKFGRQHYIRIDRVTYSDGTHDEDVPGGVDRIRRLC